MGWSEVAKWGGFNRNWAEEKELIIKTLRFLIKDTVMVTGILYILPPSYIPL